MDHPEDLPKVSYSSGRCTPSCHVSCLMLPADVIADTVLFLVAAGLAVQTRSSAEDG